MRTQARWVRWRAVLALTFMAPLAPWKAFAAGRKAFPAAPPLSVASRVACKELNRPLFPRRCASIEFDVAVTRDERLVVTHDARLGGRALHDIPLKDLPDQPLTIERYVSALERSGRRLEIVNLDLKYRGLGSPVPALKKALGPLSRLAGRSGRLVISSPSPAHYASIRDWILSEGLQDRGWLPALELVDYDAGQARAWGLPLTKWDRALLPLARAANSLYYRSHRSEIPAVVMQESTAALLTARPPGLVLCWTRSAYGSRVPPFCHQTQRR